MASHCNGLLIVISKEEAMKKTGMLLVLIVVAVCLTATTALAAQNVLEERIESVTGSPVKEEFSFYGQGFKDFILKVQNGDERGTNQVSSAIISINGVKILGPSDFNQKVQVIDRAISPNDLENTLTVSLRSNPGGFLNVQILAEPTLNLPPDPGPAGDATIEGVDVNDNGIRDDIERWIALTYPNSEKTRQALIQNYYPLQNFMIHAREGDRDAVYNDMTALQRSSECLYYVRRDDANDLLAALECVVVNTSDRVYAYLDSSRILGGGSFPSKPLSTWKQSCTFDPDSLAD
jgi:hypothetical protein